MSLVRRNVRTAGHVAGAAAGAVAGYRATHAAANAIRQVIRETSKRKSNAPHRRTPKRVKMSGGLTHTQSVKFKHKKVKSILTKKVKGVSRKLTAKINKVIGHSANFGVHKYIGVCQYRQSANDTWGVYQLDAQNRYIALNDPLTVTDAASQLWGVKTITDNFASGTNNLSPQIPIQVLSSTLFFYFKSTSSHVVNIEVYECTCKKNTSVSPVDKASENYNQKYIRYLTSTGTTSNLSVTSLGWAPHMAHNMLNFFRVKKHKVKLLPGASSQLAIKCKGRKFTFGTDDDDANVSTTTLNTYIKGTKVFFFRVINDATVSAGDNPGLVHHFSSNDRGGVAMTYTRTYRIAPIKGLGPGAAADQVNNKYIVVDTHSLTMGDDQQVAYQNPTTNTPVG